MARAATLEPAHNNGALLVEHPVPLKDIRSLRYYCVESTPRFQDESGRWWPGVCSIEEGFDPETYFAMAPEEGR